MTKLPNISGARAIRALVRAGFVVLRQQGSHVSLEKITAERTVKTVVPQHSSLDKGTLSRILKQAGLTIEQFLELL
ncbi:MAG: type II toxin-antitoxin system HicA family toxin [Candidatus Acidiferrales bacterium]